MRLLQRSFTGGELAPELFGRLDLKSYETGLALAENFIVLPHGPIANRPGFEYVAEVKTSSKKTRLIPFRFSDTQTYVLEFGDQYIRFYTAGAVVLDSGSAYEVTTPYVEADLFDLRYVQSADVMTLVHPSYAPRELKRLAHTNWTISTITFAPATDAPTGVSATAGATGTTAFAYKVTAIAAGTLEESLPSSSATCTAATPTDAAPNVISWSAVTGAQEYRVYKNENGVFGYIGTADGTTFNDNNIDADTDTTPPLANNPFSGTDNYPSTVGYYEQRKIFAATNNKPQTVWMTRSATEANLTNSFPTRDDDAITFALWSQEVNRVLHAAVIGDLLLFTAGSQWRVVSQNSDALTPSNISARPQGYGGAAGLAPLALGTRLLYLQAAGSRIRDFGYSWETNSYTGNDISILAAHLVDGHTITDWASVQAPNPIVWAVRDDGVLLGLTYDITQQIIGWHHHVTDGVFESVATVKEGLEDRLYAIIKRTVNGSDVRYIERMHSRAFGTLEDAFFVDSGLSLDASVTITGATQAKPVVITTSAAHGFANGDRVKIRDVVGMTELNGYSFKVVSATSTTFALQDLNGNDIDGTAYTAYASGGTVRKEALTLSGLDHLEGKTLAILADGAVHPPLTVKSGSITLEQYASIVHAGLPYTATGQTLPFAFQIDAALGQGRVKSVTAINVRVHQSSGIFAGPSDDDLEEYKQRTTEVYGQAPALISDEIRMPVPNSWSKGGQLWVRQSDPLPLTVLSLVPELEVGS